MKKRPFKQKSIVAGAIGIGTAAGVYAERKILSMLFERDNALVKEARNGKRYENEWFDKQHPKHCYISAEDGVRLHAYAFEQSVNTHQYMILFHGFHGYVKELSYEAKHFYERGYHIWMPSMRAHGLSEGAMITMGILEHLDACRWIKEIRTQDPKAQIALYGVSMGAATTLLALAKEPYDFIKAAIVDCPYARLIEVFDFYLSQHLHIPYRWYLETSNDLIYRKTKISLKDARPIDVVDQIQTPLMFIHGDQDDLVPYSMMDELYEKATCPKVKLTIPDAAHALSSSTDPITYWKQVDAFLEMYFDVT